MAGPERVPVREDLKSGLLLQFCLLAAPSLATTGVTEHGVQSTLDSDALHADDAVNFDRLTSRIG